MPSQLRPVACGHLGEPAFRTLQEIADLRPARLDDGRGGADRFPARRAGRLGAPRAGTVPEWGAMIPPPVTIHRTSVRPAATRSAARARGPGNRLTELGR